MITIYTALNPSDAQLIWSRLSAAGLHPEVIGELAALSLEGYSLATGGIRVQVPESEADQAREILELPVGEQ
ncbi:MAG: DUF2007 domain-containing protein [Verrucomicrobia bacterium]|nr:DUF2007 domain-containing protein [Verrucomicrobiota bacterium]